MLKQKEIGYIQAARFGYRRDYLQMKAKQPLKWTEDEKTVFQIDQLKESLYFKNNHLVSDS